MLNFRARKRRLFSLLAHRRAVDAPQRTFTTYHECHLSALLGFAFTYHDCATAFRVSGSVSNPVTVQASSPPHKTTASRNLGSTSAPVLRCRRYAVRTLRRSSRSKASPPTEALAFYSSKDLFLAMLTTRPLRIFASSLSIFSKSSCCFAMIRSFSFNCNS